MGEQEVRRAFDRWKLAERKYREKVDQWTQCWEPHPPVSGTEPSEYPLTSMPSQSDRATLKELRREADEAQAAFERALEEAGDAS